MADTEKENSIKNKELKKANTMLLMGVSLVILGFVIAFVTLSQPKISKEANENENSAVTVNSISDETHVSDDNEVVTAKTQNSAGKTTPTEQSSLSVVYPLNLNTCTAAELMTIDGIGESRANAIIAYRDYLGSYTSVEQLKNISGIGDSVYAAIEPYVTV